MDLQSALLAITPAIKPPAPVKAPAKLKAKPKAKPKAPVKPKQKLPRVVAIDSFEFGRKPVIYGSKGAHSESREPPKHDDYFPERHLGGPLYTNMPRHYPFVIHRTAK